MSSSFRVENILRGMMEKTSREESKKRTQGIKRKRGGVENESAENPKRRVRTVYTKDELKQLESIFTLQTQYPDLLMREQIADRFGVAERKIHNWFQNRRAKQRKLSGQPASVISATIAPRESGRSSLLNASPAHLPPAYFPLTTPHLTAVDSGCCPTPPYSPSGNQQMTGAMPGVYPAGRSTLPHPAVCTHVRTETGKRSPLDRLPNFRLLHSRTPSPVYPSTLLEMTPPFSADSPLQSSLHGTTPFQELRPTLAHYLQLSEHSVDGQYTYFS